MRSDDKSKDDVSPPSGYGNMARDAERLRDEPEVPPRDPPDAKLVPQAINDALILIGALVSAIVSVTPVLHNQTVRVGLLVEALDRLTYNSPPPQK